MQTPKNKGRYRVGITYVLRRCREKRQANLCKPDDSPYQRLEVPGETAPRQSGVLHVGHFREL